MMFSEIYGTYYHVLSELLERAVRGELTGEAVEAIVREKGFQESILAIPQHLESESWPLIKKDLTSPLRHPPTMPLTTLQKRWMKTLLFDPRIRLFAPSMDGLEDVEPLYPQDAIVYYDRYGDGDPYEDEKYIEHFRTVLQALREKRWLRIHFDGRDGIPHCWNCVPYKLEYSQKDDKFRLITGNSRSVLTINMARITDCALLEPCTDEEYRPKALRKDTLVLEVTDERNTLERCMLHFSHLEKTTQRIDEKRYLLTLQYERDDETELLIRVLSFGPTIKVISPMHFKKKLRRRIEKQMDLRTQK